MYYKHTHTKLLYNLSADMLPVYSQSSLSVCVSFYQCVCGLYNISLALLLIFEKYLKYKLNKKHE